MTSSGPGHKFQWGQANTMDMVAMKEVPLVMVMDVVKVEMPQDMVRLLIVIILLQSR